MSELRSHLEELVGLSEWSWLAEHADEGRLIIVSANLDLVSVGIALAEDNTTIVKQWLDDGWIHRPSADQIMYWTEQNSQGFESLIVQPFVLTKEPIG